MSSLNINNPMQFYYKSSNPRYVDIFFRVTEIYHKERFMNCIRVRLQFDDKDHKVCNFDNISDDKNQKV